MVAAFPVASGWAVMRLLASLARVVREPLYDTVADEHAAVDREVPANHEGPHGGVLLGQAVRLVGQIRLVLASIDQDQAGVAIGVPVNLVGRVLPPPSPAQAYRLPS